MSNARFSILQARAISDKRITDAQFRTLASLGMYADRDGWCFPSLTRIGSDCNKSKQAAGRDIVNLKRCGYVEVYPQFDKSTGSRRPNKYRLRFDPPVNVDDSTPSTPEVDTPSTPEVDVNVPINSTTNKVFSFPEPTPTKKQGDLVDGLLALAQSPGIKRQARIDAILSATAEKLHVRTTGKRWEEFAKLADDRQQNFSESLGVFLDWLVSQKGFNPQFWPPNRMAEFWPQAFTAPSDEYTGQPKPHAL